MLGVRATCVRGYAAGVKPEITSRSAIASAAGMLFIGTIVIVFDVRLDQGIDLVADVVGGVLVLLGILRIRGAITGADMLTTLLVILAIVSLPVTIIETLTPDTGIVGLLAVSQLVGTIVLADLLARAFARSDPDLSSGWRLMFHLGSWLGLGAYVVFLIIARAGTVSFDSLGALAPLALVMLALLAAPLIQLLVMLWRTRSIAEEAATVAEPETQFEGPAAR